MLTLTQLADHLDGVWHGNANHAIFSFASLNCATAQDLAYYDNSLLTHILKSTAAGIVLLKAEDKDLYQGNYVVVANPLQAMKKAISFLSSKQKQILGIHPTAQIHQSVQLGKEISVGAHTVIGAETQIADGVTIGANSIIEALVHIGAYSHIAHGVVLHSGTHLGAKTVINSGCVVGSSPFNYVKQQGIWQQEPVVGSVILNERVHLGANTVIDKGTLGDTYLAEGVCVDNLVHIAHDVLVGKNTVIAGCAVLGAYVQIGADCIIGGACCLAANVELTDNVVITGMSTVSKSIGKSGIYSSGTLVHQHQRWRRNAARFKRLDDYIVKLGILEKKLMSRE